MKKRLNSESFFSSQEVIVDEMLPIKSQLLLSASFRFLSDTSMNPLRPVRDIRPLYQIYQIHL